MTKARTLLGDEEYWIYRKHVLRQKPDKACKRLHKTREDVTREHCRLVADLYLKSDETEFCKSQAISPDNTFNCHLPRYFRASSNVHKESLQNVRQILRANQFDNLNYQPQYDTVQAKRLFESLYSLDEKDLEEKLAYMLLPFSEYLFKIGIYKQENVTLFEQYIKNKPPFTVDGNK